MFHVKFTVLDNESYVLIDEFDSYVYAIIRYTRI